MLFPNEITDDGIEICVNDVQPLKAPFPIETTEFGIIICSIDVQSLKA